MGEGSRMCSKMRGSERDREGARSDGGWLKATRELF
jgi:hypothetical protein